LQVNYNFVNTSFSIWQFYSSFDP